LRERTTKSCDYNVLVATVVHLLVYQQTWEITGMKKKKLMYIDTIEFKTPQGIMFQSKVLFERDLEGNIWVGYALEFDLVVTSEKLEEAESDLRDILVAHLDFAIEHDNMEHAYRSAPQEIWDKYLNCALQLPHL
jgi:hypothetical protein